MANYTNALMEGFNFAREARRQEGRGNALASYMANPTDQGVGEIARYDPDAAFAIQGDRRKQQEARLQEGMKAVGNAALLISQLPPEQQAQAWDQQIDSLVAAGYDTLAQYKGKYSPDALRSVLSQTGMANDYLKTQQGGGDQISITATQPGGSYVVRNNRGQIFDPQTNQWITLGQQGGSPWQMPEPQGTPGIGVGNAAIPTGSPLTPSQTIDGKTYWNFNGQWYDNPEGR